MTHIGTYPARTIVKTLEKAGFRVKRQRGSHLFMVHADGRATVIPIHKGEDTGRGLFRKILRDTDLTFQDFLRLLRQ